MTKRSLAWRQRQGFAVEAREPIKPKYHRELWNDGPVRTEALRLARLEVLKIMRKKGENPKDYTETALWKATTVMLFESEDVFLKRAKFNLSERT
jgi:hypothetical protein